MNHTHIAVLMGGPSAEREVSLQSGATAVQALCEAGFRVTPVDVRGPDFELAADVSVAFLALHGTFGEDGQIQRLLEQRGIPYTGSGAAASELAFDKNAAKAAFHAAHVATPPAALLNGKLTGFEHLGWPVVVKPARQGSSVGISLANDFAALKNAVAAARAHDACVLVEKFIAGRELTVGILAGQALPVIEIRTHHQFFDFAAKYQPGEAEEIVPAPIDAATTARAQALALRAHACLGCRDYSRVDLMWDTATGELFVLEVNTLPGMTANSLLPKAARAAGLSMAAVCARLVELALAHGATNAENPFS